jgi:glutamate carboxypeptidase
MDIKGGTAMIFMLLSVLRLAHPDLFNAVTWLVLANSSEEVLSPDFGVLCLARFGKETRAALVFECEGRMENTVSLVTRRKGRATFRLTVEGRAAHAGGRHQHGANAIVQIARTIDSIAALTDYSRELTFNVGSVGGGTMINRVPHQAVAEIEMRAFDRGTYEAGKNAILGLNGPGTVFSTEDHYPCRVQIDLLHETPPWPRNPGSDALFQLWKDAGESIGQRILPEARGGLSDGNLICHAIPTLDGLGPWGENDHCSERTPDRSKDQEYVDVTSFVPKAHLNALGIVRLIQQAEGAAG